MKTAKLPMRGRGVPERSAYGTNLVAIVSRYQWSLSLAAMPLRARSRAFAYETFPLILASELDREALLRGCDEAVLDIDIVRSTWIEIDEIRSIGDIV
jgi:hypothetical protein